MAKENGLGVRSIDMVKLAYKCLRTAVAIDSKHNRDNTEQTRNICRVENELGDILKSEDVDLFNS